MHATRRKFLTTALGSSALVSLAPSVPSFLLRASESVGNSAGERVLVVVQLSGGNDGLNTVVPYADDGYGRSRLTLRIGATAVLKIDEYAGFHPAMRGFANLLEAGRLGVVHGVGYPNPNRSHFESMDIWHTARREKTGRATGWLGRALDAAGPPRGGDLPALHLGAEKQPLALAAARVHAPSVRSIEQFRLDDRGDAALRRTIEQATAAERPPADELLSFVQASTATALASSRQVQRVLGGYKTPVEYPGTPLAKKLRTVAQLIDAAAKTRIYYLTIDGFDTHSDQEQAHAALLGELAGAVEAFVNDLAHHGHADRVLVMMFSEFGRRVKENASRGTDHGAAAPMFLAGGRVRGGLIGRYPSLTDLDSGDLKHHTDFRRVYATLLDSWLGQPSQPILAARYEPLKLLAR